MSNFLFDVRKLLRGDFRDAWEGFRDNVIPLAIWAFAIPLLLGFLGVTVVEILGWFAITIAFAIAMWLWLITASFGVLFFLLGCLALIVSLIGGLAIDDFDFSIKKPLLSIGAGIVLMFIAFVGKGTVYLNQD